jgi:hypothetical protein
VVEMRFKISARKLKNLCDIINISTSSIRKEVVNLVNDCVVNITPTSIYSSFSDETPYFVGRVEMKKGFEVLEEGKLQIADLPKFIEYVKLFSPDDVLVVEEDGGKIVLKREMPLKIISIPKLSDDVSKKREELAEGLLKNIYYDENGDFWKSTKYEWRCYFEILASKFVEILDDLKVVESEVKFPLTITPEKVKLNLYSEDRMVNVERVLEVSKLVADSNITNTYSFGLDGVLKVIDEKVRVWVSKDAPLIIERRDVGDGVKYFYILPPYLG